MKTSGAIYRMVKPAVKINVSNIFLERLASGLNRRSITKCSQWAEECRVMGKPFPGPWTFVHHPWLRAMHDADTTFVWGQKAAQVGYTETVLNKVFFEMDVNGVSCLYVLPAKTPDASDFSAARFDPAVELSIYLQKLFTETKNVGHKRAGSANLYLRGSRSRAGLKSVPAGLIVLDELEEMTQEHIPLVFERASGQLRWQVWGISTPSIDNVGINKYFNESTQEHFFFACPHCEKSIELIFPDSLVINEDKPKESHLICTECKKPLDHNDKKYFLANGLWIPQRESEDNRGFYINQMYSMTVQPYELAESYLRGLTNAADEQEFYNSKLGLPHIVDGARVSETEILSCIQEHKNGLIPSSPSIKTLGVDVGKWLHYEICEWKFPARRMTSDLNIEARARVLKYGKVQNFEELDLLMHEYQIQYCVIDAQPERRKSFEFAQRFLGFVKICFYGPGIQGKIIAEGQEVEHSITVDRTSWLDMALSRFRNKTISLPVDTNMEYRDNIKAPVRIYERNQHGNPIAKYVEGSDSDHYAHSRVYNELALNFAASMAGSHDILD